MQKIHTKSRKPKVLQRKRVQRVPVEPPKRTWCVLLHGYFNNTQKVENPNGRTEKEGKFLQGLPLVGTVLCGVLQF